MRLLLKSLVFTLLVPGTVTVVLPFLLLSAGGVEPPRPWRTPQWAGLLLAVPGALVYLRCLWDFARRGRGTPAPIDAPRVLVVEGLYRYTRNPMYLGVLLVLLAETLFWESPRLAVYSLAWFLLVNLFVVRHEEPTLLRRFGPAYEAYRAAVSRWLPGR